MKRLLSVPFQSLALRVLFALGVFHWSLFGKEPVGALATRVLVLLFLLYSAVTLFHQRRSEEQAEGVSWSLYVDILFAGALIFITGGVNSEFHLLFYFIITLRAPFSSWRVALVVPALCTAVYLVSILPTWGDAYWFDLMIRIGLLWFLAPLLRVISLRSLGEKEGAEKLARQLAATHDEIRRYTAALERANARNEKRLAEITLLHQFVMEMRSAEKYGDVYQTVLRFTRKACEAPWIALSHRKGTDDTATDLEFLKDPPPEVLEWVRGSEGELEWADSDSVREMEIPGLGGCRIGSLVRSSEGGAKVILLLIFDPEAVVMEEGQMEILSALMDSVQMELELRRLQGSLLAANRKLQESNHHMMRLHELQAEMSQAFLDHMDMEGVIQGTQEIMAKELFELDRLNLFLPNHKTGMLECRTSVGIGSYPPEKIAVPIDKRGGAISKAFREGKTIFFGGETAVPAELRLAEPYSQIPAIRSRIFVIVPLLDHHGDVLGVIGADRKHTHRPIPKETVTMLEFFARHVAMVLFLQEKVDH